MESDSEKKLKYKKSEDRDRDSGDGIRMGYHSEKANMVYFCRE